MPATPDQTPVQAPENPPAGPPPAARAHLHPMQLAVVAALIAGYALLSHYSESTPGWRGLGAGLSVGPVLLIGAVLLWRWTRPLIALGLTVGATALTVRYWGILEANFEWADLIQQCGAYTLVALAFARTLFSGRVPLCTRLAAQLHGSLAPSDIVYNRRATLVWAAFYFLLAVAIVIVFLAAPLRVWSFFVNFVTFGLIGAMCVADYAVRRQVLPRRPHEGLRAMVQRILIG